MSADVKVLELTDNNFEEVINSDKPVLVDFWATWCGPCKMLSPIVEDLAGEYGENAVIGKMDIGSNQMGTKYGLLTVPTLMIFRNGEKKGTLTGVPTKAKIKEEMEKAM